MSVYRHSPTRLWAHRHRVLVGAVAVVVVAGVAAGVALAVSGRVGPTRHGHTATPATTRPPATFSLASTVPGPAQSVESDSPVTVHFTDPVDLNGPMPSLTPPVPGTWARTGLDDLTFDATAPFIPGTAETLTIPGGTTGVRDRSGQSLAESVTVPFTVASSTVRLQQLLAQLGYLPVSFTPTGPPPAPRQMAQEQPGSFAWRWSDPLSGLEDSWSPGFSGVMTMGAVMTFENQHQLSADGLAGPRVWQALLAAASAGTIDTAPYDYVVVSKTLPENLTLYVNGAVKFAGIPVNTGIPGVDTPDGTYPVFEHVTASDMKGTNLDGSTYNDPNVPWASYFYKGDALHGFVRSSYGSPQSNGCVEMSIANAGQVWPFTPIGTLVTVTGPGA